MSQYAFLDPGVSYPLPGSFDFEEYIDTERELETLGLDDLLAPNCILLIEWGEKFPRLQRDKNLQITLERVGETERRIEQT